MQVFENDTLSGSGTEIAKLYLTPNAEGRAHFDLSDVVGDRVESCVQVGSPSGPIFVHTASTIPSFSVQKVARQYIVKAGQYNEGTGESLDEANANVHLFNGTAQISQGKNPSFDFLEPTGSTQQVWMTDRELFDGRYFRVMMADEDQGTIQFLKSVFLGGTSDNVTQVVIKQYDSSDTLVATLTQSITLQTSLSNNIYQIPCGPAQIGGQFAGGLDADWAYLTFQAQASRGTALSRIYRVQRDCRPIKHDPVQLCWVNTLGAWDTLRFDGRNLRTTQTESKTYRKAVGTFGGSSFLFNSYDAQRVTYQKTAREQYNLQNLLFTSEERELLQYAFRSKQVFFRVGSGDWLPCNILTSTYTTQPAGSQMFEVSFDIELAQDLRC